MINFWINGKAVSSDEFNLKKVLQNFSGDETGFAVAVNEYFIPKAQYENTQLKDGDRVELVVPMAGG